MPVDAGLNNSSKYATKWAFIYVAVAIFNTFIVQKLNLDPNSGFKSLGYIIPAILFLVLTQLEYRRSIGGYMSFQQGFSAGVRYAVYSGLLFGIFIFIYLSFFSKEIEQSTVEMRKTLNASGMSKEQIEDKVEFGLKYGALIGAFFAAIQTTIIGVVISAICAAVLKKEAAK